MRSAIVFLLVVLLSSGALSAYTISSARAEPVSVTQATDAKISFIVSGSGTLPETTATIQLFNASNSQSINPTPTLITIPADKIIRDFSVGTLQPGSYSALIKSGTSQAVAYFTVKKPTTPVSVPDLPPVMALLVVAGILALGFSRRKA
ncbi:MAG: hypothetical protein V1847_00360 [Candidatus Diapherotrites archaeon]